MEGPIEDKDSGPAIDKPIKSEGVAQSPDSSERSNGSTSPPPNCSICLEKLINTSFTDSCLHQFCFTCLLQWSKIKTECPLCKQTFKSIIHNVRSEEDYDQYHVPRELASQIPQPPPQLIDNGLNIFELDGNWDLNASAVRRFFYRPEMAPNRRRQMLLNPEQVARREQIPSITSQVPRDEQRRRRANPLDFRRRVYRLGIWAAAFPDVLGRFRECSAEYYRRQPRELDRLVPWLNRELHVLLNNAPQGAYIMRMIMDALPQYDIRSPQFRDLVRPYFGVYTEQFLHELLNYARTNFDLIGYDQAVIHLPPELSNTYAPRVVSPVTSSSDTTSDDSDVRVLDEAIDLRVNIEMPNVGPHSLNMPGPSTVAQAFQLEMPYNVPDVLTISSTSSSSDECQVVGYVKPRHARTPEIVVLLSSDSENTTQPAPGTKNTEVQRPSSRGEAPEPSTSDAPARQKMKKSKLWEMTFASMTSDSVSESGNSPKWSRHFQSRERSSSKKSSGSSRRRKRSNGGRSRTCDARNQSTSEERDSRKRRSKKNSGRSRKRLSSSSDSSYDPGRKIDESRGRRRNYSTRSSTKRAYSDVTARASRRYVHGFDSSSSESSTESNNDSKTCHRSRAQWRSKRKFSSSSASDLGVEKTERLPRSKEKLRRTVDETLPERRSRSQCSSLLSFVSEESEKSSQKQRENVAESSAKYATSGSEDGRNRRSSSQGSGQSRRIYVHRKRSKHKKRCKSKSRKRSDSRTFNSYRSNSSEGTSFSV